MTESGDGPLTKGEDVKLTISTSAQKYGYGNSESRALVSNKTAYIFLKLKRKKTEDATDICEIERNGLLVAVTACKFSSEFGNNCFRGSNRRFARHFQYTIVEPFGEEILTINGYQMPFCASKAEAEFTKGKQVIGRVVFSGKGNNYEVKDGNNQIIYRITNNISAKSLLCCPCKCLHAFQFRILLPDGTPVGEMGDRWDVNIPYLAGQQARFGISFPQELEEGTQWILLASSLLLRWQFWRPFSNGIWCLTYLLILMVILLALALSLYLFILK